MPILYADAVGEVSVSANVHVDTYVDMNVGCGCG